MKRLLALSFLLGSCGPATPVSDRKPSPSKTQEQSDDDDDDDDHEDHDHDVGNETNEDDSSFLLISWDASTDDTINSYRIYKAEEEDGETEFVSSILVTDSEFDPDEPQVSLSSETLEQAPDDTFCILVSAVSEAGESEKSVAACL